MITLPFLPRPAKRLWLFTWICLFVGAREAIAQAASDQSVIGATFDKQARIAFPKSAAIIDVTRPPYNARGDGKTDDTRALQNALSDVMGKHRIVYLPNGVYLVSRTIRWSKKNADGSEAWGFTWLQGQNPHRTIIRLRDDTFRDPEKPQAIMWCGGFGSADWFHNYIQDVTFDVGRKNPGAIGLQFYSNNTGALRNVAVVSQDGAGVVGLDLADRDMNGPLLVRNVLVRGFGVGIRTGHAVNSQTFERISLINQSKVGLANDGQSISIRGLASENEVPALRATSFTTLLDSKLVGKGRANRSAAVLLGKAPFHARNVTTSGYRSSIATEGRGKAEAGPRIREYFQGEPTCPFGGPVRSPGLTVRETPDVPWDDPRDWAVVDRFGADPTGNKDSSDAVQKAIDSGARTVFFPGFYTFHKPVIARGKVRRLLGVGAWVDYQGKSRPDFIIGNGEAPVVLVEHFAPINGGMEVNTERTVVFRSLESRIVFKGTGAVFLEDVASSDLRLRPKQRVWARQLNVENEGTHVTNDGAELWILGYKTERGGTLVHTRNGGVTELFGNFSYTTTAGKLAPMFVTRDAWVFAFFNEVCFNGDPFQVLIRETRSGTTKVIKRGEGSLTPYSGGSSDK